MQIIDFRFRPPFGDFLNPTQMIFNPALAEPFAARYDAKIPNSVREKSMDLAIAEMDSSGIAKGIMPVRVCQGDDNLRMAEVLKVYPDRFIGFAGLPTQTEDSVGTSLDYIDEFIVKGPYVGAFLEPGFGVDGKFGVEVGSRYADDKFLFPIYEKCQKLNIPLLISHGGFTVPNHGYNDPIYIDHVAEIFPDLHIILGHACWPYAAEACYMAMLRKNVWLSPDLYMINSPCQEIYAMGANYRLRDKIIFGSAYPVIELSMAVEHYKKLLRPEVWNAVFHDNAMAALGLE